MWRAASCGCCLVLTCKWVESASFRSFHFKVGSQNCEKRLLASSCLSVRPPARPAAWNSAPTGRIFMKFDIWVFCEKPIEVIQVLLKSNKNNWYFPRRPIYIYDNLTELFLERENFRTKLVHKMKTHVLTRIFSSSPTPENPAVYEIMWENSV
jgi:hypothetical protein